MLIKSKLYLLINAWGTHAFLRMFLEKVFNSASSPWFTIAFMLKKTQIVPLKYM